MLIATGDRWHAAASILAAKAGKDVYSEKPCGITHRSLSAAGRHDCIRKSVCFRRARSDAASPNFQKAVELAHTGRLGKVHTLHASIYVPGPGQHMAALPNRNRIAKCATGICGLGPAAWRPFNQKYVDGRWLRSVGF